MSDISPVGPGAAGIVSFPGSAAATGPAAAQRVSLNGHHAAAEPATASADPSATPRMPDRVELSDRAILESIRTAPEIRPERVAAVREMIERGDYPSDEQITIAIDRLVARLVE